MSKKDFELIARVLKQSLWREYADESELKLHKLISDNFADELAQTNPRFDRNKFLKACGVSDE